MENKEIKEKLDQVILEKLDQVTEYTGELETARINNLRTLTEIRSKFTEEPEKKTPVSEHVKYGIDKAVDIVKVISPALVYAAVNYAGMVFEEKNCLSSNYLKEAIKAYNPFKK